MRRLITFDTGPSSYHLRIPSAHPNILTAGSRGRVLAVQEYLDDSLLFENPDRGKTTVHGTYKGMPVTAFSSGEGTGSVSCTWPEVIEACDENDINLIRIGTSGGYRHHQRVGDCVITDKVVGDEGTSRRVVDLLREFVMLYHKRCTDIPKGKAVMERIQTLYPTPQHFSDAVDAFEGSHISAHGLYQPETDRAVSDALFETATEHKVDGQTVSRGTTEVTPDIYANIILRAIESTRYQLEGEAVSMEASALCAYRDFYNLVDGRSIRVSEILMVSDLVVGEADNMQDFLAREQEFTRMHILTGLEALLKLGG